LYIEKILAVVTYTSNRREWASIDRALQTKKYRIFKTFHQNPLDHPHFTYIQS